MKVGSYCSLVAGQDGASLIVKSLCGVCGVDRCGDVKQCGVCGMDKCDVKQCGVCGVDRCDVKHCGVCGMDRCNVKQCGVCGTVKMGTGTRVMRMCGLTPTRGDEEESTAEGWVGQAGLWSPCSPWFSAEAGKSVVLPESF